MLFRDSYLPIVCHLDLPYPPSGHSAPQPQYTTAPYPPLAQTTTAPYPPLAQTTPAPYPSFTLNTRTSSAPPVSTDVPQPQPPGGNQSLPSYPDAPPPSYECAIEMDSIPGQKAYV